ESFALGLKSPDCSGYLVADPRFDRSLWSSHARYWKPVPDSRYPYILGRLREQGTTSCDTGSEATPLKERCQTIFLHWVFNGLQGLFCALCEHHKNCVSASCHSSETVGAACCQQQVRIIFHREKSHVRPYFSPPDHRGSGRVAGACRPCAGTRATA